MIRLVLGDPFELRPGKARHRLHPNDARQIRIVARKPVRLAKRASIVVQDRGANRLVGAVEQHRAVHLAREADRRHPAERFASGALEVGDRAGHRGRPIGGVLLRPAGVRTGGRIGAGGACDRLAALVDQKRLKPGGSAVQPEIHGRGLCARPGALTSGSARFRRLS